jgi:hypothetical protein
MLLQLDDAVLMHAQSIQSREYDDRDYAWQSLATYVLICRVRVCVRVVPRVSPLHTAPCHGTRSSGRPRREVARWPVARRSPPTRPAGTAPAEDRASREPVTTDERDHQLPGQRPKSQMNTTRRDCTRGCVARRLDQWE